MKQTLTTANHSRTVAGLKYVYPVISRRAGGLSIGINFNPNNACNWRCVYCQVPDLVRGSAPDMDFQLLENELRFFLHQVLNGDFFNQFNIPEDQRCIKDIAISGNGEPTSLKGFDKAVALIGKIATEMQLLTNIKWVLITNGSLIHQLRVQEGLQRLNDYQGEVWFKLDSATEKGRAKLNETKQSNLKIFDNLKISTQLCETKLQTCLLKYGTNEEMEFEQKAYFEWLKQMKKNQFKLNQIMLYTLARASLQPEASQLEKLTKVQMDQMANQCRLLGYQVNVSY